MKLRRSLSERLTTQKALLGFMQTHPSPALAEMAGLCGYDFIFLDCEHGLFSEMDILQTLQALASSDTAAFVRLRNHDMQAVGRYMDLGVDAIVVPDVTTPEEARMLVRAMHYPPTGTRGFAASVHRTTGYGRDTAAHLKAPREGVWLIAIIESARGVTNSEAILAVEGLDGVIVGPSDLSADLGGVGNYSTAAYAQAFARVERAAVAHGKILASAPHAGSPVEALIARGHRVLIIGADMPLIREAMGIQVMQARSAMDTKQALGK